MLSRIHRKTVELIPRSQRASGLLFGDVPSTATGPGLEIADIRQMEPDDDPRYIDPIATALAMAIDEDADPVIRERLTELTLPVLFMVDRNPTMRLYDSQEFTGLLDKHWVVNVVGHTLVESALLKNAYVGYIHQARFAHPNLGKRERDMFWRAPNLQGGDRVRKVQRNYFPRREFFAPKDTLARQMKFLATQSPEELPPGTMCFIFSDFFTLPRKDLWMWLEKRMGLDLVPVLVQDPLMEQSFPLELANVEITYVDPLSGRVMRIAFTRRKARELKRRNEQRFRRIQNCFRDLRLDPIVLSSNEQNDIFAELRRWERRRKTERR